VRQRTRETTTLALGSVVSGLLAYLFFALTTRSLGPTAAAPIGVLWTYWTFASAALTFPLQHWIAQTSAAHGDRSSVARAMPRVLLVVGSVALVSAAVALAFRETLFHSSNPWYPALVGLVTVGAGFIGVVRGGLTAQHRFMSLTATFVGENLFRCAGALVLISAGATNAIGYGLVLVLGSFVGLGWPSAYRLRSGGSAATEVASLRFLGGAAGGQLMAQVVLTSGPVILAFIGGSPAQVTSLFAALALFRAPYLIALAVVAKLTGYFTSLHVRRDDHALRRVRNVVLAVTVVGVPLAGVVGAFLGPVLLPLIFGEGVTLDASLCLVIAMASTVALTNLVTTLMIMAQGRSGVVMRSWVVAAVLGLAFALVAPGEPLSRTVGAFLLAEVAAVVLLVVAERRRGPRPSASAAEVPGLRAGE
jgi:O-antigen/teichoic acid export membrane protein